MVFMPTDKEVYDKAKDIIEKIAVNQGHKVLGWRRVPTNNRCASPHFMQQTNCHDVCATPHVTFCAYPLIPPPPTHTHTFRSEIGPSALSTEPIVEQFFVCRATSEGAQRLRMEQQMYVLRKLCEQKLRVSNILEDNCYICSLSSRTIVYKGQLTPEQVGTSGLGGMQACAS